MKIVCAAEKLLDGINKVQRAVSSKTALPILEGILIEANDRLKLAGNDLEIAIECYVEADIIVKGSIVVNSRIIGDIISKMPNGDVLLEVREDNVIYIECESTHFKVKGLPASGFPGLPALDEGREFTVESGAFRDMVRQTIFAASTDESQPIYTGVLVECNVQDIVIVAADRVARMAYRHNRVTNCGSDFNAVIPARTLNEISKMIKPDETELALHIGSNHVTFRFAECTVMSRVINGKYINYRSIMREDYETKITVDRKRLLSCFERAILISSGDKKYPVILNIDYGKLSVSCKTEVGEILDEINIDMDGRQMSIGFNPYYFIECLRVIEDENIEVLFATDLGPGTVKPVNNDNYAYVIGAIRIQRS